MEKFDRIAIVATLIDELRRTDSWCGETHLQKLTYFLQELLDVPLGYPFVLYKHGPYSFDLSDELTAMRGYFLVELEPRPYPFGPSYRTTETASRFIERHKETRLRHIDSVKAISREIGNRSVVELERLGTALFVSLGAENDDVQTRATQLTELKPHISFDQALDAVREIDILKDRLLSAPAH